MEKWSKGKNGGTVITDSPEGLPENSGHTGTDTYEYYGGALVCESIWRKKDVALISAAPNLLEACKAALKHHQRGHSEIGHILKGAINKATNI